MENKNRTVRITVNSTQHAFSDTPEVTVCTGTYRLVGGTHVLSYRETDADTGMTTTNLIKLNHDSAQIKKSGNVCSFLCFDTKKTHRDVYRTPYANFPLTVRTKNVCLEESAGRLFAVLNYSLFLDHSFVSDYTVQITAEFP